MIGSLLKTLALCLLSGISVSQPKSYLVKPQPLNPIGNYSDVSYTYNPTNPNLLTVSYNNEDIQFYSMASLSLDFVYGPSHVGGTEVFSLDSFGVHYTHHGTESEFTDPFGELSTHGPNQPLLYFFSHIDDNDGVNEYLYFYAMLNVRTLGPNTQTLYTSRYLVFNFTSFDINDTYWLGRDCMNFNTYSTVADLSLDETPFIISDYNQSTFFDGQTSTSWKGFQVPKDFFEALVAIDGNGFALTIHVCDLADGKGLLDSDYDTGYQDGLSDGKTIGYREGYTKGYNEGLGTTQRGSFFNLFGALADTPLRMLYSLFSFDLFGMSALVIVLSFLTGIFVIKIVKKFL